MPISTNDQTILLDQACQHLIAHDPVMATIIEQVGSCTLRSHGDYYKSLVDSILGQQLSLQSAAAIRRRFIDLFDGDFPSAQDIVKQDVDTLRSAGLSRAKAIYIQDLAAHIIDGRIHFEDIDRRSNQTIIHELTAVKGIGEWTVHMFLIFCLGRLDVLPAGDLGIKNAVTKAYNLPQLPKPADIAAVAAANSWHPYESVASWYLWQSLTLGCYTTVMDHNERALQLHKQYKGKITISLRDQGELDRQKLSAYYSPGVGAVSKLIAADPSQLPNYTWTNNLVAVISDGSAVLGLGNLGPEGAMPVMEGKAMLFKHFANIDSVPIVLNVHSADDIVHTVEAIAPSFGAINLEDIAAPICFEVEERLKTSLPIPVMHDDQHGTAIVTLAGLLNACKVTGRELRFTNIVILGAGAAGVAIAKLLHEYGQRLSVDGNGSGPSIFAFDSKGIIHKGRTDLNDSKRRLLEFTNLSDNTVGMDEVIGGTDIIIGVSGPGTITGDMVRKMHKNPIIFALANPDPEISPDDAKAAGAAIIATGRSDYPNQVNNAIAFPGIFRGALDNRVRHITDDHKLAAANVIASLVENPTIDDIIPSVFDERLVTAIAAVIK